MVDSVPRRPGSDDRSIGFRGVGAVLVLGVALWAVGIVRRSLWIDEFHSLVHARAADLGAFL